MVHYVQRSGTLHGATHYYKKLVISYMYLGCMRVYIFNIRGFKFLRIRLLHVVRKGYTVMIGCVHAGMDLSYAYNVT